MSIFKINLIRYNIHRLTVSVDEAGKSYNVEVVVVKGGTEIGGIEVLLAFFFRLGGATGIFSDITVFDSFLIKVLLFELFVLAITSGSCNGDMIDSGPVPLDEKVFTDSSDKLRLSLFKTGLLRA